MKVFRESILKSNFKVIKKLFNTNVPSTPNSSNVSNQGSSVSTKPIDKWEDLKNIEKGDYHSAVLKQEIETNFQKHYKPEKGIIHSWENSKSFNENIENNFIHTQNIEQYIFFVNSYKNMLDTLTLFERFHFFCKLKDTNRELYTDIIPHLKEYIAKFDRNSILQLYYAVAGACHINLADNEFWNLVENKLVLEKLFRYLPLEKVVDMACLLKSSQRGSIILNKYLELELVKQRKAIHLKPKYLKRLKETFALDPNTSTALLESLKNPDYEITKNEKLV